MGKMLIALVMVFALELSLGLFVSCIPGYGVDCDDKTSLFTFLLNPQNWSLSLLIDWITSNAFLIGGTVGIVVGTTFWRSDFLVYLGIAAVFFSFGQTIYVLWQHLANFAWFSGNEGPIVATILTGGAIIYFLIATLDFARGRD